MTKGSLFCAYFFSFLRPSMNGLYFTISPASPNKSCCLTACQIAFTGQPFFGKGYIDIGVVLILLCMMTNCRTQIFQITSSTTPATSRFFVILA